MNKDINKFLQDLYKLDPSLKNQEPELIELINQMLASKPDAKLDEEFARALRDELIIKAEQLKPNRVEQVRFNNNFNPIKKFAYAISGAVICAVLFIAIYNPISKDKNQINLDLGQLKISQLDRGAFGAISLEDQVSATKEGKGFGGGGGGMPISSDQTTKMIAPTNYTYVYSGEEFQLDKEEALIYKYQIPTNSSKQLAGLLKNTDFGLVDINKFNNLGLENLTLTEDRDFGHMINIDLTRNMISIQENWTKWQQNNSKLNCASATECSEQPTLRIEEVPSDEELIAMADNFLSQYGINREHYGNPIVQGEWRVFYEQSPVGLNILETIQVTYPLIIDGQKVYDQGGYPVGLNVNVNIRYRKVSAVYGLRAENYQSATYNLERDKDEILKMAAKGGLYNYFYDQSKTSEIELDSPEFALIRVYNYKDNNQEEILVPGLIFSIKNKPNDYYGNQKVVVLLVKDIVETNSGPEPRLID